MRGSRRPPDSVRAVVTDVDGTLTDESRRLDLEAVRLLRTLEDSGTMVILATGNVLPIALAVHRSIGLSGPIVAENGGLLYLPSKNGEEVRALADRRPAWEAYRKLLRAGLPVRRLFTDRWRETEVALEPTVTERRIRPLLRDTNVRVESTGFALHLMERGAGKLPALREALAATGLRLADCLVAGDGDNDVAMLRAAGWAVSFPTASRRARAAADYVTRADYACGFVEAVKTLGIAHHRARSGGIPRAGR